MERLTSYLKNLRIEAVEFTSSENSSGQRREAQPSNDTSNDENTHLLERHEEHHGQSSEFDSHSAPSSSLPEQPVEGSAEQLKQTIVIVCMLWTGICALSFLVQAASSLTFQLTLYGDWNSLIQILTLSISTTIIGWPSVIFALLAFYYQFVELDVIMVDINCSVLRSRAIFLQAIVFFGIAIETATSNILGVKESSMYLPATMVQGWLEAAWRSAIGLGLVYYRTALWLNWIGLSLGQLILLLKLLALRGYEDGVTLWTMIWYDGKLRVVDERQQR